MLAMSDLDTRLTAWPHFFMYGLGYTRLPDNRVTLNAIPDLHLVASTEDGSTITAPVGSIIDAN